MTRGPENPGSRLLAIALAAAALIAGCGSGGGGQTETTPAQPSAAKAAKSEDKPDPRPEELESAWVAMDGWDTPETAGFPMAEKLGYFTDAGLSVLTLSPVSPKLTIPDVVTGLDAVGVAHGPQAVLASAKGAPVVVLSTLIAEPTAALIWLKKSGIVGVPDLKGKTIAIPGLTFQEDFLGAVLARGGLTLDDVKVESVGNDLVPALASGRADAIFGGSWNIEGVELKARGLEPQIIKVQDLGIPAYDELVLVARSDIPPAQLESVHGLADAVAQGGVEATKHPEQAVKALKAGGESNPETSAKVMRAQLQATIPLLSTPADVDVPQLEELVEWMHEQGMIPRPLKATELLAE